MLKKLEFLKFIFLLIKGLNNIIEDWFFDLQFPMQLTANLTILKELNFDLKKPEIRWKLEGFIVYIAFDKRSE